VHHGGNALFCLTIEPVTIDACVGRGSVQKKTRIFSEIQVICLKGQGDAEKLVPTANESLLLSSDVMCMKFVRMAPGAAGPGF
jgi:hypothetical protein